MVFHEDIYADLKKSAIGPSLPILGSEIGRLWPNNAASAAKPTAQGVLVCRSSADGGAMNKRPKSQEQSQRTR
jgi:hypothetical protein